MRNAWSGGLGPFAKSGLASQFMTAVVVDFVSNPEVYLNQKIKDIDNPDVTMRDALAGVKGPSFFEVSNSSKYLINKMPRNSIIARVISGQKSDSKPEIFLPFFPPHISFPVNSGEQIWIMYEKATKKIKMGYWICRKSTILQVDDLNYTHLDRISVENGYYDKRNPARKPIDIENTFTAGNNPLCFPDGGRGIEDNNTLPGKNPYEEILVRSLEYNTTFTGESVPRFSKRGSDLILQGSNNTLISLGQEIGTGTPGNERYVKAVHKTPDKKPVFDMLESIGKDFKFSTNPDVEMPTLKGTEIEDDLGMGAIDIVVGRGRTPETAPVEEAENIRPKDLESMQYKETNKAPEVTIKKESNINEGNPDFINDLSRIYLSMKSNIDKDLELDTIISTIGDGGRGEGFESEPNKPVILLRTDQARIMAREDLKITVGENGAAVIIKASGDIVFIPGAEGFIKLGGNNADRAILCTGDVAQTAGGTTAGTTSIATTAGGAIGDFSGPGVFPKFGTFASKVLVVGNG